MKVDGKVILKIREYIISNDISLKLLASASGISYHRLWAIINQNLTINLGDYLAICKAFKEPFDYFLDEKDLK